MMFDPVEASFVEGEYAAHRLVVAHDPRHAAEQAAKRREKIAAMEALAEKLVDKLRVQEAGQTDRGRKASDRGAYSVSG